MVRAYVWRSARKIEPLASRLSKAIGTDADRSATYDFLLVIYCKHGLISYVPYPKQTAISVENREFFQRRVFNVPAEGVSVGIS